MRKLVYRLAANRDLKDIVDFIGETSGDLDAGLAGRRSISRAMRKAGRFVHPSRASARGAVAGIARLFVPWRVIFFRCIEERLEVVNILHSRRDLAATLDSDDDSQ
jgi:toxin ParE1/3/4